MIERFLAFFVENFPSGQVIAVGGPLGLVWAYACLSLAGYLRVRRRLKTGYTRKVFHFATFISVVLVHQLWGTPVVCLYGGMTSLVVLYAIIRGDGHPLYEAMARPKDAPRRTYFIVAPYFATLVGGLASNMLFGPVALVGYLTTGLGDAVGEPVGTRYGRHPYRVPSLGGVPATRTLEGSAAVFVACLVALAAAVAICPELRFAGPTTALMLVGIAGASALIEAVSPHGWDNATLQILPSLLAHLLL